MSYGREESGATGVSGVAVYGLRELLDVCWTSSNSHVPTRLMTIMLNEVGCFASFPHLLSAAILPALPIVHKSRMEPPRYSPRLLFELLLSLTALLLLAAELVVPWLLWLIKPMRIPLVVFWSMRSLWETYRFIAWGYGKLIHLL